MELNWVDENVSQLDLQKIIQFESAIAVLLEDGLKSESSALDESDDNTDSLLPEQQVLSVHVQVSNVTKKDTHFRMHGSVDVILVAPNNGEPDAIPDMASVLIRLSRKETVQEPLTEDVFATLGTSAESIVLNFKSLTDAPNAILLWDMASQGRSKEQADTALILACSLLSGALVLVTGVLLYVAGGWRDLRDKLDEQLDWFKTQRRTDSNDEDDQDEESGGVDVADSRSDEGDHDDDDDEDDDDDDSATNASGIIGASSKDEQHAAQGLGINRTPERGIAGDGYDTTPYSEMSGYTDSSRANLGITSIRKMQGNGKKLNLPPLAYK